SRALYRSEPDLGGMLRETGTPTTAGSIRSGRLRDWFDGFGRGNRTGGGHDQSSIPGRPPSGHAALNRLVPTWHVSRGSGVIPGARPAHASIGSDDIGARD